ncbi:hypothetical protein GCM10011571_33550 [Marinithermofilum abyssi]|uniref:Uncharacterized protein n=1 Tax=Marinithermofilum abyssi TaxID=1571185 RepID=A0A8J2VKS3_9BACL|nr:hypothetical protein [Marinithermofilum abyssi]GGE28721.1 hypothetical protein GCM10011571_33550 [Marinithermofilum abyssi]
MERDYVTLKQLCEEMEKDRSNARKQAIKLGIPLFMVRAAEDHNQLTLAMSPNDADYFKEVYTEGYRIERN